MLKIKKGLTDIVLAITMGLLIIFDVIVAVSKSWDATLSRRILVLSGKFPLIAFGFGILASHFFLSKLGRKITAKIGNARMYIWIGISIILAVLCIINLFMPIGFIVLLCDNRWLSFLIGMAAGLFWGQEKGN